MKSLCPEDVTEEVVLRHSLQAQVLCFQQWNLLQSNTRKYAVEQDKKIYLLLENTMFVYLISSLSDKTRNSKGLERLAKPIQCVSD